ncbi:guanine-N(7)-methyltransferase domain-containing protein [Entophlyctis helioformis]|nr:guanine-N(7)-methyltransferase domain-containing protein [Entophlyctis helioformis]
MDNRYSSYNNSSYNQSSFNSSNNQSSSTEAAGVERTVAAKIVASHYNARPDKGIQGRSDSVILQLKNYNNWVKAVLISRYTRPESVVLDLCCGKGGDLQKWKRQQVRELYCLDIASVSVDQARARYNQSSYWPFAASFHVVDCFSPDVATVLNGKLFDLISIQFSLHYSFETEERARQAILNVASHLQPGGHFIGTIPNANWIFKRLKQTPGMSFGNAIYNVKFETKDPSVFGHMYRFVLADAIDDCPEYMIQRPTLERLAQEQGMRLVYWKPFHEFYDEECLNNVDLLQRMNVFDDQGTISPEQWEAVGIYTAFAFQKVADAGPVGTSARHA